MPGNRLTTGERAELGTLVSMLDCDRVRLYGPASSGSAAWVRALVLGLSRNRAVALGNHVFMPDHCLGDLPTLAHELVHCGQYQSWGPWRYYGRGILTQLRDLLHRSFRIGPCQYRYRAEPGKPFREYGMEQQAQMVEDWFRWGIKPFRRPGPWTDDPGTPAAYPPTARARCHRDRPPLP